MSIRYLSGINVDSNVLFVDSANDRVGIGTGSPSYSLDINGVTRFQDIVRFKTNAWNLSDDGFSRFYFASSGRTYFGSGNGYEWRSDADTALAVITNAGNVGIGTTSPAYKLDVAGTISNNSAQNIIYASYDAVAALFQRVGTYGSVIQIGRSGVSNSTTIDYPTDGTFAVSTAGSERLRITSAGNVGIGTTSPAVRLSGKVLSLNDTSANLQSSIELLRNGNSSGEIFVNSDNMVIGSYETGIPLVFRTQNNEHLRITSAGNVGIGTTAPGYKLQVEGAGRFSNGASGTLIVKHNYSYHQPNWGIKLDGDTGSSGGYLSQYVDIGGFELAQGATYYGGGPWLADSNSTTYSAVVGNGGTLIFSTNSGLTAGGTFYPSERMRITSGGNVLIGTTTDVGATLNVNGSGLFSSNLQTNGVLTIGNQSVAGNYFLSITPSTTVPVALQGVLAGTGAANISLQASGGNVGIGTTSPTERLHVDGNARVTGKFYDSSNSEGTSGQVLSSTGTGTAWISGGGGISGSGTTNYVTKWTSSSAVGNSSIYDNGNVGIGTTSPGAKLHVDGGNAIFNNGSADTILAIETDAAGLYDPIFQMGSGQNTIASEGFEIWYSNTVGDVHLSTTYNDAAASIRFHTATGASKSTSNERMIITGAGNVGIGTTAPGAYSKLQVKVGTNYNLAIGQDSGAVGLGAYNDAVNATANLNITGTIISFSSGGERMRITSAGNVGIGTTTPLVGLDVRGTAIITNQSGSSYNENLRLPQNPSGYAVITLGGAIAASGSDASQWSLLRNPSNSFEIRRQDTVYALINSSGNVGIGTTSPVAQLQVTSASNAVDVLRVDNTAGNSGSVQGVTHLAISHFNAGTNPSTRITAYQDGLSGWPGGMYFSTRSLNTDSAPVERVRITSGGYVGISTTSPQALLDVNGDVIVRGTLTELSTRRIKENITPLEPSLEKVNKLEPVSYNKIDTDNQEIGLIAEDVAELFPEVVTYDDDGRPQGIQYQRLSVILLKAVQELTERVNKLENK